MNRLALTSSVVLASLALVGCASKVPLNTPVVAAAAPVTPAATSTAAATGAQSAATPQSAVASVDLTRGAGGTAPGAAAPLGRYVFFDFDSFAIDGDDKPTVDAHARRLASDRNAQLRIAGHADERGGREYNLALGQRRADAVARSIVLLGGDERRIEAVSYGEERPKVNERTETAWAQNRRAELVPR
jgi:peptidoglycan-associated lipoprotein